MKEFYSESPNWHELPSVYKVKQQYQKEIQQVFTAFQSRVSVCCCVDCEIEFITSRSNSNREDLRCLFGCRNVHRKRSSNQRALNYYRSDVGRKKKQALNQRRSKKRIQEGCTPKKFDSYQYYRWLVWAVDNFLSGEEELNAFLGSILKKVRQHSIVKEIRMNYIRDP